MCMCKINGTMLIYIHVLGSFLIYLIEKDCISTCKYGNKLSLSWKDVYVVGPSGGATICTN